MLWEAKDDQKEWRVVNITVDSAMEFQVAFIAMKSDHAQTSYVAIDDIEYRPGVNCYGVVTDIVVGGAGNTAAIVAAVILVLAALVCLAVATNHWYKNRSVCFRGSTDASSAPFGFDNISYRNRDKNTVPVETVQGPGIADRQ
ncbi:apical endosomal glycoprotein-like [Pristis pectinata]|uniref:apical endosomal glycoprotein-like n=1 Tax=Pristis pectinata TaxID=685728 RepID=UPI00223DAC60|nr:apical endosomal glycoprotein-like [Pristis pectinata]